MAPSQSVRALVRNRPESAVAAVLFVVLVATSGHYGWHRDELYFVVAGQHPAWGYPDQPLLTPFVVAALNALGGGSLTVVRLASALAGAGTVLVVGAMAGQLGGTARARLIGSLSWAVGAVSLVTGHFIDTTTFDVLATAGVCSCLIICITKDSGKWMVVAGAVLGVGLLNKMIIGAVAAVVVGAILAFGPRRILLTRHAAIAAGLSVLGAAPYVLWQAFHAFPQLALVNAITAGGAEGGRVGVVPFQVLLVSPFLAAFWIAGLLRLLRTRPARPLRGFGVAYLVLVAALTASSGKAYYVAGLLPVLVAAGGISTDLWIARSLRRLKIVLTTTALSLALAVNAAIGLAILPASLLTRTGIESINPDAGEQLGWGAFTSAVAQGFDSIPAGKRSSAVIFTANYAQAGAVDKFGGPFGLPRAYSGHNGFAQWGPPVGTGPVVLVGFTPNVATAANFLDCHAVTLVNNGLGLGNAEQGDVIQVCDGPGRPWHQLWPSLVHYG